MSAAIRMQRLRQKERTHGFTRYEVSCLRDLVDKLKRPHETISHLMSRALEMLDWQEHSGQKYRIFTEDELDGYVYLLKFAVMPGFYKIGMSKGPVARLKEFNEHYPEDGIIVHTIAASDVRATEKWFHKSFARTHHGKREWFKLSDRDVQSVRAIARIDKIDGGFRMEVSSSFWDSRLES
jgi:hypothetical protein